LNSNRELIAQLHETLYPRIVRYIAVRIGDFVEAEDLGSEVFVRALRAAEKFQNKEIPIEAWIFRIAHNLVVDHLKAKSRRPKILSIEKEEIVAVDGHDVSEFIEQALDRERDMVAVHAAIAQLSEAQQQVLALRFSDAEMTSEQIAQILGKKPTAVREMLSTAIKRLRTILRNTGKSNDGRQVRTYIR
jgi:RNA polymerase sigma-70 factor (ECF subfamily)